MTPGQRHALLASAALVPFAVYEAVEISQGDDGWPYSRWLRLLPPELFVAGLIGFNAWFGPHILRRAKNAAVAALEAFDDRPTFDTEES